MIFGMDFIKWLQFAIAVLHLLAEIFGDDDAVSQADKVADKFKNGVA